MIQEQEQRRVYYDKDLKIEAYNLSGVVQKFPNHFHEYYVIGFVAVSYTHLDVYKRQGICPLKAGILPVYELFQVFPGYSRHLQTGKSGGQGLI